MATQPATSSAASSRHSVWS